MEKVNNTNHGGKKESRQNIGNAFVISYIS